MITSKPRPASRRAVDVSINTSEQRKAAYPPSRLVGLKPPKRGEVRNPRGRPKGSRHKLSEAFLADMLTVWEESGRDTIRRVATEQPLEYLKLVASLLPKHVRECQCEGMCEEDFNALSSMIVEALRADREARETNAIDVTAH